MVVAGVIEPGLEDRSKSQTLPLGAPPSRGARCTQGHATGATSRGVRCVWPYNQAGGEPGKP